MIRPSESERLKKRKQNPNPKQMLIRQRIPSHDETDPVQNQIVLPLSAKTSKGIEIDMITVVVRANDLRGIVTKMNLLTTTIIPLGKTVAIVSPEESSMAAVAVDTLLRSVVATTITTTTDHHQMDIILTFAIPTIAMAAPLFRITWEMGLRLILVPILAMDHHLETFEGEVDHIRRTVVVVVVVLLGIIRIAIRMGHRGEDRLYHTMIDAKTGIGIVRGVHRIRNQNETMVERRDASLLAVARIEKTELVLRDRKLFPPRYQ